MGDRCPAGMVLACPLGCVRKRTKYNSRFLWRFESHWTDVTTCTVSGQSVIGTECSNPAQCMYVHGRGIAMLRSPVKMLKMFYESAYTRIRNSRRLMKEWEVPVMYSDGPEVA